MRNVQGHEVPPWGDMHGNMSRWVHAHGRRFLQPPLRRCDGCNNNGIANDVDSRHFHDVVDFWIVCAFQEQLCDVQRFDLSCVR